jgi:hypothetical protein
VVPSRQRGNAWGGPHAFPASLDLLHRLGQISEIADAAMAARHAVRGAAYGAAR